MNKQTLIEELAKQTGCTKLFSEEYLDTLVNIIIEQLKTGEEVSIVGFGAFSSKTRPACMGVNPKNPTERMQIPETVVARFKAGKNLKDALKRKA